MKNSNPVVYVKNESVEFFEQLHHFLAVPIDNGENFEIVDWFGRSKSVKLNKEEFNDMFVGITQQEFEKYAHLLDEGDTELIDDYLNELKNTYSIN